MPAEAERRSVVAQTRDVMLGGGNFGVEARRNLLETDGVIRKRRRLLSGAMIALSLAFAACAPTTAQPPVGVTAPRFPAPSAVAPDVRVPRVPIPEQARGSPGAVVTGDGIEMDSMTIYGGREAPPDFPGPARVPEMTVYDPWEPVNRRVARFNHLLDTWALDPAAEAWDETAPDPLQRAIANFFDNLRFPVVAGNNLLQGKPAHAASDAGRFLVNTTLGLGGFLDPAANMGMAKHDEDFGQTLARWGMPPGPFIVLPVLGPSNVRDTTGLIVDVPMGVATFFVDTWILLSARVVEELNSRSLLIDLIRAAKQSPGDLYSLSRGTYGRRRERLIRDEIAPLRAYWERDLPDEAVSPTAVE